jgi:hypothetical protein
VAGLAIAVTRLGRVKRISELPQAR